MQDERRGVLQAELSGLADQDAVEVVLFGLETALAREVDDPLRSLLLVARTARDAGEDLKDGEDLTRLQISKD